MKSSTHVLASLLVAFTTFSQSANATTESKQYTCNQMIDRVKSQLRLEGYGKDVSIERDNIRTGFPKERPYNVTFSLSSDDESGNTRKGDRQPQFSKNILAKCPQISSVTFYRSGTDFAATYGLINGQIKAFPCYYLTAINKIPWGYNPAHVRCYKGECPKGMPCNP